MYPLARLCRLRIAPLGQFGPLIAAETATDPTLVFCKNIPVTRCASAPLTGQCELYRQGRGLLLQRAWSLLRWRLPFDQHESPVVALDVEATKPLSEQKPLIRIDVTSLNKKNRNPNLVRTSRTVSSNPWRYH
jgi:hypothetical protein